MRTMRRARELALVASAFMLGACGARSEITARERAAGGGDPAGGGLAGGGLAGGGGASPGVCGNGMVEPDEPCDVAVDPADCHAGCVGRQARTLTLEWTQAAAVTSDQMLRIWGTNFYGTFGETPTPNQPALPLTLPALVSLRDVSSYYNVCTVDAVGAARCAGLNNTGQLGTAPATSELEVSYELVPLSTPTAQLAMGAVHACALDTQGKVSCWGAGSSGEVDGNPSAVVLGPTLLPLEEVDEICATDLGNCARSRDGSIRCWGDGQQGFLTIDLPPAVEIACGGTRSCARFGGGAVACWDFSFGTVPEVVVGAQHLVRLGRPSSTHACGVAAGGGAVCWGSNDSGELGRGAATESDEPADDVLVIEGVAEIAAGSGATCARLLDGRIACWGNNQYGVLGTLDGTLSAGVFLEPVFVSGF